MVSADPSANLTLLGPYGQHDWGKDSANTALRIFLQEMGEAYDEERGRSPYKGGKQFEEIRAFFGDRCCYCGTEFGVGSAAVQDHLIPMNKADLGLHAWGNIVPACNPCNAKKQRRDWRDFIIERAGADAGERQSYDVGRRGRPT